MYYKITNQESDVYKKLHNLRTSEKQIEKDNIKFLNEKIGIKWSASYGHAGQQNFTRVTRYTGFVFVETDKIDPKVWIQFKDDTKVYIPNPRTKVGREMREFLRNGVKQSNYDTVLKILKLPSLHRFSFPYVEIAKDTTIIIFLGEGHEPTHKDVIEITKTEFNTFKI